jgi:hypothetical protein
MKMPFHCAVASCRRTTSPCPHPYRFPSGHRGGGVREGCRAVKCGRSKIAYDLRAISVYRGSSNVAAHRSSIESSSSRFHEHHATAISPSTVNDCNEQSVELLSLWIPRGDLTTCVLQRAGTLGTRCHDCSKTLNLMCFPLNALLRFSKSIFNELGTHHTIMCTPHAWRCSLSFCSSFCHSRGRYNTQWIYNILA